MAKLNPKQQRFVAEYLIDSNATQAAIRAGYSAKTAKQQGSRLLLTNADVTAAVAAGQVKVAEKLEITAEKVLRDLEEVRTLAMAAKEFAPAIRAIELCGKHIGMFRPPSPFDEPDEPVAENTPTRVASRKVLLAVQLALRSVAANEAAPAAPPTKH